jgi:O-antigen/teichoic acid export membrane protein
LWAQLFDFGILNGLTNALGEAFGRDDYSSAQSYICTSFLTTAIISILGIVLWIVASLYVPWSHFIHVDTVEQGALLGKGICIIGSFFLLTLPFLLTQRILQAYQRLYIYHGVNLTSYLLTLIILIIGVHYHYSLLQLLFATNVVPFVCHVLSWCILTKKISWARFSWKHVRFGALKRLAHSSIPLLAAQVVPIITSQMIPILLVSVTNLKEVSDFGILWKIYVFIFFMMGNISNAYCPGMRDAFERGEIPWIKNALKRLLLMETGLIIAGCSPLLVAGNAIIKTWIRLPLEQPLDFYGWLIYTCCILFAVLNCTVNSVLIFLDKIVITVILTILSSIALFIGILSGVPKLGLIVIFGVIGITSLISIFYSFKVLKRMLNDKIAMPAPTR